VQVFVVNTCELSLLDLQKLRSPDQRYPSSCALVVKLKEMAYNMMLSYIRSLLDSSFREKKNICRLVED